MHSHSLLLTKIQCSYLFDLELYGNTGVLLQSPLMTVKQMTHNNLQIELSLSWEVSNCDISLYRF